MALLNLRWASLRLFAAVAAVLFNKNVINVIAGFIRNVDSALDSLLVTTIQQKNAGGGGGGGVTSTFTAAESSTFPFLPTMSQIDSYFNYFNGTLAGGGGQQWSADS
ncbi:hypothetical protein TYRP_023575 [Tyrophagus putrescentiae]|nr:hypothetical protein TYRP_023575 [Tyrophagus putrescentiae]